MDARLAQIVADNKAKRQAILADVDLEISKKAPICRCGTAMTKHLTQGYYWCRFCEIREVDLINTRHESRESKQAHIKAKNDAHPLYGFARRLAAKMLAEHGYKSHIVFRNIQGANHQIHKDGTHVIKFGFECVKTEAKGYKEYPTSYQYLWADYPGLTGKMGVWALVIHEVAHAIQTENGGRWHGSQHNQYWAKAVKELQILYPYEEVKDV